MRCSPTFSESSFSLSFFLTTPARKPRTECGCQPVTSMMAAMVVPFAWRSIPSTVSCFEGQPLPGCADAACAAAFGLVVFLVGRGALGPRLMPRDGFAICLVSLDCSLLVAIRPSLCQRQHDVLPLPRAPRSGRATGGGRPKCAMAPSGHHTRSFRRRSRAKCRPMLWLFAPTSQAHEPLTYAAQPHW